MSIINLVDASLKCCSKLTFDRKTKLANLFSSEELETGRGVN